MKLYDQILGACRSIFGLDAEATEAEIHNALDGQKPLAEIQNGTAMAELNTAMAALTEKVTGLETQVSGFEATITQLSAENTELKDSVTAHLATITANETAITAKENEVAALTTSHNTQVAGLAAQIAALKAGKDLDNAKDAPAHAVSTLAGSAQRQGIIPLADEKLRAYLRPN